MLQARAHPSLRTPTGDPIYIRMKAEKCIAIPSDHGAEERGPAEAERPAAETL